MTAAAAVRAEAPFAAVLTVALAGIAAAFVRPEHWLRGVLVVASALLAAGVLRLVLPRRRAGLLAVRSRLFDAACYLVLGALLIGFGLLLPR